MSAGNGTGTGRPELTIQRIAKADTMLRLSFADMSSQQRARSLDNMARQIADLSVANNMLTAAVQRLNTAIDEQRAWAVDMRRAHNEQVSAAQERWDASSAASKRHGDRHQAFVSRSFMARLRWLVTGR